MIKNIKRQIILASASPRRKKLLSLLDFDFAVVDSGFEEVADPKLSHEDLVKYLALGKAKSASKKYPKAVIIAADTMIAFKGKIIGKPKNKADAIKILKKFSGQPQEVLTGVVVLDADTKQVFTAVAKSKVWIKKLALKDILDYIKTGEPFDKAGAYGPLGKGLNVVQKVGGEFTNVLGLPMSFVLNSLEKLDVKF